MVKSIDIFCPATVANVSVGYDILGFCLDSIGDQMQISRIAEPGVQISEITGYELPLEVKKNVAGLSALALVNAARPDFGFDIKITKRIKPGSGIGSSAASAAGAVFGINKLLGDPFTREELIEFALEGESYASKSRHADNLAPCIFGGFTLVRSLDPVDILNLPSPKDLAATIIHPQIEIKTSDSRAVVPEQLTLNTAVRQLAEMGSFVHALHTSDYDLISRSLNDHIIEPYRSKLIPYFQEAKKIAVQSGALGFGISGSGPSMYALSRDHQTAKRVENELITLYSEKGIDHKSYVSGISGGIKVESLI